MSGDASKQPPVTSNSNPPDNPIVVLLRGLDETAIDQSSLSQFVQFMSSDQSEPLHHNIPMNSLTFFMKRYVEFQIFLNKNLSYNNEQLEERVKALARDDDYRRDIFLKSLSRMAFYNLVYGQDIKWKHLKLEFYLETSPMFSEFDWSEKYNPISVLKQKEGTQGQYWIFKERFVQEYLAACCQVQKFKDSYLRKRRSRFIGKKLRQSMKLMPATSDVWMMTLGLASVNPSLNDLIEEIFKEFFGLLQSTMKTYVCNVMVENKKEKGLKDVKLGVLDREKARLNVESRLARFFVEAVFETENAGHFTKNLERFLTNDTVDYSNVVVSKNRAPYAVLALSYFLSTNPKVYGLHLAGLRIDEVNVKTLTDSFSSKNTLQVLDLSCNSLGRKGLERMFSFFVKASELTHLDISNCVVGDRGLALFAQAFICMPLVYLNISSNGIGKAGAEVLSKNLCYVPSLEWLDLSSNDLGSGALVLTEAMSRLPCLRFLDLGSNRIGDEGAAAVARLVGDLSRLERISMAHNLISYPGSRELAESVVRSKSIRSLDLRFNKIPSSGVVRLKKAAQSHGKLQVATWEQDPVPPPPPPPSVPAEKNKDEDADEKLLGMLNFKLSIAISKVAGGELRARVNDDIIKSAVVPPSPGNVPTAADTCTSPAAAAATSAGFEAECEPTLMIDDVDIPQENISDAGDHSSTEALLGKINLLAGGTMDYTAVTPQPFHPPTAAPRFRKTGVEKKLPQGDSSLNPFDGESQVGASSQSPCGVQVNPPDLVEGLGDCPANATEVDDEEKDVSYEEREKEDILKHAKVKNRSMGYRRSWHGFRVPPHPLVLDHFLNYCNI